MSLLVKMFERIFALFTKDPNAPANGAVFWLTLPPELAGDPRLILRQHWPNWESWKYVGNVPVAQRAPFRLLTVDPCDNLEQVREQLGKKRVPESLWISAFMRTFPNANVVRCPVSVADPSLEDPDGNQVYPSLFARQLNPDGSISPLLGYASQQAPEFGRTLWLVYA